MDNYNENNFTEEEVIKENIEEKIDAAENSAPKKAKVKDLSNKNIDTKKIENSAMSADSIPEIPSSIDKVQEEFIKIFNKEIKRPGMDKLVDYLVNKSDFFIAPASTRFHLSEEGGLARHSLNVYYRLKMLVANEKFDIRTHISQENIAICGLLHDVCKANYYIKDLRNVKKGGQWTKEPFYKVDEKFPYGHGEKSVFIISQYMNITANEAMAINWHMGPYDDRVARSFGRLGDVFEKFPLALLTHIADLEATYMDEV